VKKAKRAPAKKAKAKKPRKAKPGKAEKAKKATAMPEVAALETITAIPVVGSGIILQSRARRRGMTVSEDLRRLPPFAPWAAH